MKIEELKKVRDILSNVLKCHKTEDCNVACSTCPNDFDENEYDEALDTAITVMGDVIKQMEKMTTREVLTTNDISN